MAGRAFVFINPDQAARFGHVGWGFALDEAQDLFYFGSTDHLWRHPWWSLIGWLRYAHVAPAGSNDWWSKTGTFEEMMIDMHRGHHIRYHSAKEVSVTNPNPESAQLYAESLAMAGWSVLINNCVHQAHEVLRRYGAVDIPGPGDITNLVPRLWFARLPGRVYDLSSFSEQPSQASH
jgi:hypothetical protein